MKKQRSKSLTTISFKAEESLARSLRLAAREHDLTISQIVRKGLQLWFAEKGRAA